MNTPYKTTTLLGISLAIALPLSADILAADTKHRLEQESLYQRSAGRRLDPRDAPRCESCDTKVALTRSKYLNRVLLSTQPESYEQAIEAILFEDKKFTAKCWNKNSSKGMDLFFTVSESGAAEDIAWFPKEISAKCIKRHVRKIAFPPAQKPHYAWFVVDPRTVK